METFADRLRIAMKQKRMSATELAKLTGVSKGFISQLLSGYCKDLKANNLHLLALALNVSESWLMGWDEENNW